MARRKTVLASLAPEEAARVLTALVKNHPELAPEAESLAAEAIAPRSRQRIAAAITRQLCGLSIDDLAERAGTHYGRHVEPWDAVRELVDGIVGPHLEDARRLAGFGRVAEAHQVAAGVLAGLYGCGEDTAGHEVLGYVELSEQADDVMRLLAQLGIPLPPHVADEVCPAWRLGR